MTPPHAKIRAVIGKDSPLLSVEGLTVSFPGQSEVVHGISFSLPSSSVLGLTGPSGCGKSVSMLALLGLLDEARVSGKAIFRTDGMQVDLLDLDEKGLRTIRGRRISYMPGDALSALNPFETVSWQLSRALKSHGWKPGRKELMDKIHMLLSRTALPGSILDRLPSDLSGGQRQRVLLAMALAQDPGLLIADEPTASLDVTSQAQVMELFKTLVADDGLSIILITHELGPLAGIADHVLVMDEGHIVEEGSTDEVFLSPSSASGRLMLERAWEICTWDGRPVQCPISKGSLHDDAPIH